MLSVFDIRIDTSSIDTFDSHVASNTHRHSTAIESIECNNIALAVAPLPCTAHWFRLYDVSIRSAHLQPKTDWQYNRFYRKYFEKPSTRSVFTRQTEIERRCLYYLPYLLSLPVSAALHLIRTHRMRCVECH